MRRRSAILFVLGCAIAPGTLAQWTPDAAPVPHFGDDPSKTAPSSDGSEGSAYELKQAIVEACLANLGPDGTPALWLEGDLDTMAVQFLDSETGSAVTLKESTDFGRILAARTVRVTKREFKQPKTLTHRADVELGAVNMED